ncbi:MAG: TonB family protein [Thermodesulfobacteriota bacterium]
MVRCILAMVMFVFALIFAHLAGAVENSDLASEQVLVVDRSTRSKPVVDYVRRTRDAIQKAWTTPLDQETPDAFKGKLRVNLLITKSGSLEWFKLIEGSGRPEMDRSMTEAIRKAAPFPPFPTEIAAKKMLIRANLVVANVPSVQPVTVSGPPVRAAASELKEPPATGSWGKPAESTGETPAKQDDSPKPKADNPPRKILKWGSK